MDYDKLEGIIIQEIQNAEDNYTSNQQTMLVERAKLFESNKDYYKQKYPKLEKISDIVSSDVQDTIEWAMPDIMRIFLSTDDIINLSGVNEEDVEPAKIQQDLINFQLQRLNSGYIVFHDWFKTALIYNMGILKCYWCREAYEEIYEATLDERNYLAVSMNPRITIIEEEQVSQGIFYVKYKLLKDYTINQPKIEVVSPSEFIYDPKAKDLDDCSFVAQRKKVTKSYILKKSKQIKFRNLEEVLKSSSGLSSQNELEDYLQDNVLNENETEEAKKEYLLYECYWETDINNDGILEPCIAYVIDDKLVFIEENETGRHPFFGLSPIRDPLRLWAKQGLTDLVGEIQNMKTAFLRQIIYNIARNNNRQAFVNVDVMVDPQEFIKGNKAIRVHGDPKGAVYWTPEEQMSVQSFTLFEYMDSMKENKTGITKYNQGLDSSSLNKTATGISAIMQASNKRLEMIVRMFAETGIRQLFKYLIKLNQMYMDNETVVRVTNREKPIKLDDIKGDIDVVVNASLAVGDKNAQVQKLMQLIQLYPQAMQIGAAGPEHAAFAFGKLVEELGFKDKSNFCYSPDIMQQKMMEQQQQQAMMMQQQQEAMMQQQAMGQEQMMMEKQMEMEENDKDRQHDMDKEIMKGVMSGLSRNQNTNNRATS